MKTRREFLIGGGAGLCVLAAPLTAQQPGKVRRIGFLGATSASAWKNELDGFHAGLRDLGYAEGKNILVEYRWAEGQYERLPELLAELIRAKVELIVTHGTPGTRAAKAATTTVPIVMAVSGDAVATGLVASLARPGGNITGSTYFALELAAKRLELLRDAMPRISRAAVLVNPDNASSKPILQALEAAARSLKVELQPFEVRGPGELDGAFSAMARNRVDAVLVDDDGMLITNRKAIADLAAKHRMPSTGRTDYAEAGGLMAYGVDIPALWRRAGFFVDKILKGAKPGDIPVERTTRFELVVNLKTAKALGLIVPQPFLMRADRVIE